MSARRANKTLKRIKVLLVLAIIVVLFSLAFYRYGDKIYEYFTLVAENNVKVGGEKNPPAEEQEGNKNDETLPDGADNTEKPAIPDYSKIYRTVDKKISQKDIVTKLILPYGCEVFACETIGDTTFIIIGSKFNFATDKLSVDNYITIITVGSDFTPLAYFTLPSSRGETFTAIYNNNYGFTIMLTSEEYTTFYSLTKSLDLHAEHKSMPYSSATAIVGASETTVYCTQKTATGEASRLDILTFDNNGVYQEISSAPVPSFEKVSSVFSYLGNTYARLSGKNSDSFVKLDNSNRFIKSVTYDKIYSLFPDFSKGFTLCAYVQKGGRNKGLNLDGNLEQLSEIDINTQGDMNSFSSGRNTLFYDNTTNKIAMYVGITTSPILSDSIDLFFLTPFKISGKTSFLTRKLDGCYSTNSNGEKEIKNVDMHGKVTTPINIRYNNGLYVLSTNQNDEFFELTYSYFLV